MRTHSTQVQSGTRKSLRPRRGGVPPERDGVGETEQTILEVVDRGGLHINEHELRYQLARRQVDSVGVLERMRDLEQRGLVESTLCFRLTQQGVAALPDGHERPLVVGYRSDWSVEEKPGTRDGSRRA
jgi:hypothetical protein